MSALSTASGELVRPWEGDAVGQSRSHYTSLSRLARGLVLADVVALVSVVTVLASAFGFAAIPAGVAGLCAALVHVAVTSARGGYSTSGLERGRSRPRVAMVGVAATAVAALSAGYLFGWDLPRRLMLTALVAGLAMTLLNRALHQLLVFRLRRRGQVSRRALLVGESDLGLVSLNLATASDPEKLVVLGRCGINEAGGDALGTLRDVPSLLREFQADTLIVAANAMSAEELRQFTWRIGHLDVDVFVAPEIADTEPHRVSLAHCDGTPMIQIGVRPSRVTLLGKAALDRVLGCLLGVVALTLLAPAVIAIKLTSPGPAIFRQTRVGVDGVPFTIYKLRTMFVDAEERLSELVELSDGNDVLFKLHDDPRVTSVGRILRRTSLDELPQLWNVVRGDMSLVGPRPPLPHEVAEYDDRAYHRLVAKPGITGLWQVSGRSNLDWDESVTLDLRYVDNRSVRGDLRILGRTAGAVVGGRGAY